MCTAPKARSPLRSQAWGRSEGVAASGGGGGKPSAPEARGGKHRPVGERARHCGRGLGQPAWLAWAPDEEVRAERGGGEKHHRDEAAAAAGAARSSRGSLGAGRELEATGCGGRGGVLGARRAAGKEDVGVRGLGRASGRAEKLGPVHAEGTVGGATPEPPSRF